MADAETGFDPVHRSAFDPRLERNGFEELVGFNSWIQGPKSSAKIKVLFATVLWYR